MNVSGIPQQRAFPAASARLAVPLDDKSAKPGDSQHPTPGAKTPKQPHDEKALTDPTRAAGDEEPTRGVLRLLQDGHFKGVADVRLRIVFHDELAEASEEAARLIVEEKLTALIGGVDSEIEALLVSSDLAEEVVGVVKERHVDFNATVTELGDAFVNGQATESEELLGGVRSAFESLLSSLRELLGDASSPDVADGPSLRTLPAQISEIDGGSGFDAFIGRLQSVFATAFEALSGSFDATHILPELSEPSGNGAAYDRFLAVYNELNSTGTMTDPPRAEKSDSVV
jgi:hypothetical protein